MIKIDKGIPFPANKGKYPFQTMEPGDSFYIGEMLSITVSSSVSAYNRRGDGKQFSMRKENNGVRVWRVK